MKGTPSAAKGEDMVHVTFNDRKRILEFWTKRGNKAEIFEADIEEIFIEKIKREAVKQEYAKAFPDRPQIDDPTRTNNSYGIPKKYFDELLKSIKNPRIVNPK